MPSLIIDGLEHTKIFIKRQEIRQIKHKLSQVQKSFLQETDSFIASWLLLETSIYVEDFGDNSLILGKANLRALKREVLALHKALSPIIFKGLSDPTLWWHLWPELKLLARVQEGKEDYMHHKHGAWSGTHLLESKLRYALGSLGLILDRYGYASLNISPKGGPWVQDTITQVIYYSWDIPWSGAMEEALQDYRELYQQGNQLFKQMLSAEGLAYKEHAFQLWHSL